MRVLLIEPDPVTRKSVELMLIHANMNVYVVESPDEALELCKLYDYDMVVMETCLDGSGNIGDAVGQGFIKDMRMARIETPIVVLARNDSTENKIRCFGMGADDFLAKPFHREELVARIVAVHRRSNGHAMDTITTGNLEVDLKSKVAKVNGTVIHLTLREFEMLELLSLRKGTTLTKEMFLNHLYGGMDEPELKIIDVFICKLRRKISQNNDGESYIETVWGRGYSLRDPEVKE